MTDEMSGTLARLLLAQREFGAAVQQAELGILSEMSTRSRSLFFVLIDAGWYRMDALDAAIDFQQPLSILP